MGIRRSRVARRRRRRRTRTTVRMEMRKFRATYVFGLLLRKAAWYVRVKVGHVVMGVR